MTLEASDPFPVFFFFVFFFSLARSLYKFFPFFFLSASFIRNLFLLSLFETPE